jgi:phospholipid/cholesterol/gamma-HCH transport system permease protein
VQETAPRGEIDFERRGTSELAIRLRGSWLLRGDRPPLVDVERALGGAPDSERASERGPERASAHASERSTEAAPERKPDRAPERAPERASERSPDRAPEHSADRAHERSREPASNVERDANAVTRVVFDASELGEWDSALLVFLDHVLDMARARSIEIDTSGLPSGVQRLLELAATVTEKRGVRAEQPPASWLARVGSWAVQLRSRGLDFVTFLGECAQAVGRCFRRRAHFRMSDLLFLIQQTGAEALPITTLIAFLVGLIMAFVGAVQLQRFGANIFIADLVGLAMTREMGAMMTAIIMAGRTGAAYAAQIGTMKVTEELDALTTLGLPPLEFLVLPRLIALFVMMPLLCLYADLVGIIGGAFVATGMLDLTLAQYMEELTRSVTMTHVWIGVVKSAFYGILIALSGCYQGTRCGSSASSVGDATTASVVVSIVAIVSADGIMAILCNVLKI